MLASHEGIAEDLFCKLKMFKRPLSAKSIHSRLGGTRGVRKEVRPNLGLGDQEAFRSSKQFILSLSSEGPK